MSRRLLPTLATVQLLVLLVGTTVAVAAQPARPAVRRSVAAAFLAPRVPPVVRRAPAARPRRVTRPRPVTLPQPIRQAPSPAARPVVAYVPPAPVLSPDALMRQAIARIPGYIPGLVVWSISSAYGHWGTAVMGGVNVYVAPDVPPSRMYDVVAHEWSHMLSIHDYNGQLNEALAGMNQTFGGSGIDGAEKAADCMAIQLGATWTHYTTCTDPSWQLAAKRLLAGLPA